MSLPPPRRPQERVFVNASLRFESIQAVGFDMDYTLAVYDSESLERLAFGYAVEILCSMGYPAPVAELAYRPRSTVRGLVVDTDLGNVLKMDRHRFVSIAVHGDEELDTQARRARYTNLSIPLESQRFTSVDTLFSMPEVDLYQQLVALKDARPQLLGPRSYSLLWADVRHAVDLCHRDGRLKRSVLADLGASFQVDPELADALQALRAMGKKLFLLTNSEQYYTEAVMAHLLDGRRPDAPRWTDYFDHVVVDAGKPGYFLEYRECEPLERIVGADGKPRQVVGGGNYRELHQLLGCKGDDVLFVGDHIYGDVIRSKTHSFWRTLMIVPELDQELDVIAGQDEEVAVYQGLLEETELIERRRTRLRYEAGGAPGDAGVQAQLLSADQAATELYAKLKGEERRIDQQFHPRWGALFHDGGAISRFGAQVARYADLYTSRVSNLARCSPDRWFHTPMEVLPHRRPVAEE